ncbi:protein ripply3 isoform A [Patagioenas fasciata monilis]|uniref:Protein ripply3 n=1 Tax=Patagioenas fasciata monilis TaxID=372326 RepID=A0A1V4J299_PATFA|nr:protein ripply3 isoform A [Patagioenas fasciata monilis]
MEAAAPALSLRAPAVPTVQRSRRQRRPPRQRERPQSSPALWRPWMLTARDGEMTENQQMVRSELDGQITNFRSKGALGFQHPVRLYLPKSKSQKFLNNIGEKVLASFPVQATIHFYNDDADSEEDEEEISSA